MGCLVTNVTVHTWQQKNDKKTHRCRQVRTDPDLSMTSRWINAINTFLPPAFAKVMFSQVSPGQVHPSLGRYNPQAVQPPPRAGTPPGSYTPTTVHAGKRSTSGRYASHWNAFLFWWAMERGWNRLVWIGVRITIFVFIGILRHVSFKTLPVNAPHGLHVLYPRPCRTSFQVKKQIHIQFVTLTSRSMVPWVNIEKMMLPHWFDPREDCSIIPLRCSFRPLTKLPIT